MIKRINIYVLVMTCMSVLLLTACSSSDTDPLGEEGGHAERYLQLVLKAPATTSRTQVPDTPDTAEESMISDAEIYLVREGHITKLDIVVVSPINEDSWEARSEIPESLSPGDYYLYVVANPDMNNYNKSTYAEFVGRYDVLNPTPAWQPNHFLMVNTTNDINSIDYDATGGRKITIPTTPGVIETTLSIERLAVKVQVEDKTKENPGAITLIGSDLICATEDNTCEVTDISITRTTLLNCVNSYNLIQKWAENNPNSGSPGTTNSKEEAWLLTPSTNPDMYDIETGYYNRLLEIGTLEGLRENSWVNTGDFMYCLENNPPMYSDEFPSNATDIPTKSKGRTTAVLIETQITVSDCNEVQDGTIYRYGDKLYTCEEALMANNEGLDMSNAGIQKYKEGKMYYIVWLRDDRYQVDYNGTLVEYYALFRNSWNILTVTGISGWGDEEPSEPPTDPIDEVKIGLDTEVRVNFWKIENVTHTLGENNKIQ